jgi:hypothetical protein
MRSVAATSVRLKSVACVAELLVLKAVTDLADRKKGDDHRAYALTLVSRFAAKLLIGGFLSAGDPDSRDGATSGPRTPQESRT